MVNILAWLFRFRMNVRINHFSSACNDSSSLIKTLMDVHRCRRWLRQHSCLFIIMLTNNLFIFIDRCVVERREFDKFEEESIDERDNEDLGDDGGKRWSNSKLCRLFLSCRLCCGKINFLTIYLKEEEEKQRLLARKHSTTTTIASLWFPAARWFPIQLWNLFPTLLFSIYYYYYLRLIECYRSTLTLNTPKLSQS